MTRRRRGWAIRLAVFALLFQALLPLVHRPPSGAQGVPAWALASLCRSPGTVAPSSGDDRDQSQPAGKVPPCPICASLQVAHLFMPRDALAIPLPSATASPVASDPIARIVSAIGAHRPPARAPPLTA